MKVAIALFNYFPYGGLQKEFLRVAEALLRRNHEVDVYTMSWEGAIPDGVRVFPVAASGFTNHGKCASFAARVRPLTAAKPYAVVVGFNRMPGLDLYYGADVCFEAFARTQRPPWYKWLPRYRLYSRFERAVCSRESTTVIALTSEVEKRHYMQFHGTQESRFHLLPPGVSPDRRAPANAREIGNDLRREQGVGENERIVLMVGSDYRRKGLDRALRALAALPPARKETTRLWVLGRDKTAPWLRMAESLGVRQRLAIFGARDDVPRFLFASDLLLHPAYVENTGMVICEAIVAGLPVVTTDACGYAVHVKNALAGTVVACPFDQRALNDALLEAVSGPRHGQWSQNALAYAARADLYSLPERAADVIESVAAERSGHGRV